MRVHAGTSFLRDLDTLNVAWTSDQHGTGKVAATRVNGNQTAGNVAIQVLSSELALSRWYKLSAALGGYVNFSAIHAHAPEDASTSWCSHSCACMFLTAILLGVHHVVQMPGAAAHAVQFVAQLYVTPAPGMRTTCECWAISPQHLCVQCA